MDADTPGLHLLEEYDQVRLCPTCRSPWIVSESDKLAWETDHATACLNCGAMHQLRPPDNALASRHLHHQLQGKHQASPFKDRHEGLVPDQKVPRDGTP